MKSGARIFVSYARSDGSSVARQLRQRLTEEHGFTLWQDIAELEGGRDWWGQIVEAISEVEHLVLVMTPAALVSDVVRKEWRFARQNGVCVVPVLGEPDIDFDRLPGWMRDTHFVDVQEPAQWRRFVRTLEGPCNAARVPFMAEDLPVDFVARPAELDELAQHLVDADRGAPVAITAALRGAGGYGKTTLAKSLCHDERVLDAFHDGVLWVTLGENPGELTPYVEDLIYVLSGERPGFAGPEPAAAHLAELLADRSILMVLDDVWNVAHIKPFVQGGHRCARLITTRNSNALPAQTRQVAVDAMRTSEAVHLLLAGMPDCANDGMNELATRLGEWPLLLKLVNAVLYKRVNDAHQSLDEAVEYVNRALDRRGLAAFDARNPVDRNQAVASTLGVSIALLGDDEVERLEELSMFPEDTDIPLDVVEHLWDTMAGLDSFETEDLCDRLFQLSLILNVDLAMRTVRLHDVIRTYLQDRVLDRQRDLHARFLDGYRIDNWKELRPEQSYLWRHLGYHLSQAGRLDTLQGLTLDYGWIKAKLNRTDITALIADYQYVRDRETCNLVRGTLRLAAHILARNSRELPAQLIARLAESDDSAIRQLLAQAEDEDEGIWLRPVTRSLTQPGDALLLTLLGHRDAVESLAVTPNGHHLISAGRDSSIKIWDLETGTELLTLTGHLGRVSDVAVAADSLRLVSSSEDRTVRVWDLQSGNEIRVLSGHEQSVRAVAITADGSRAVSASDDGSIRLWDLQQGVELERQVWPGVSIRTLVMSPDSGSVVFASFRGAYRIWDLSKGLIKTGLAVQHGGLTSFVVSPDGQRIISTARDRRIYVTDLESGRRVRRLRGHDRIIRAVAVTADGRRAISASDDRTIKVWDLEAGAELATFRGHDRGVVALAIDHDGKHVVSACEDHSIRIWSLESAQRSLGTEKHRPAITALGVTPDGKVAVSATEDGVVTLWDTADGRQRYRFMCQRDIEALAVSPDARSVVSAAGVELVELWHMGDRIERQALYPSSTFWYRDRVTQVAISNDSRRIVVITNSAGIIWDSTHENPVTVGNASSISPNARFMLRHRYGNDLELWDLDACDIVDEPGEYGDTKTSLLGDPVGHIRAEVPVGSWFYIDSPDDDRPHCVVAEDGQSIMSAPGHGRLVFWNSESERESTQVTGHEGKVSSIAVSADGDRAVSVSDDRSLKLWEAVSGKLLASFTADNAIAAVALSSDGRTILAGDALGRLHNLRLKGSGDK